MLHDDHADQPSRMACAYLAPYCFRLFGPGKERHKPVLARGACTSLDGTRLLLDATRHVLSFARNLLNPTISSWSTTAVDRVALTIKIFTDLYTSETLQRRKQRLVYLGWDYHGDIVGGSGVSGNDWWKKESYSALRLTGMYIRVLATPFPH